MERLISLRGPVFDRLDLTALNFVCYTLFIVDVVEDPNHMIVNYLSEFLRIQFEVSYSSLVLR